MSLALTSSFHRAAYEFEARTNARPTKLLLGKREMRWLETLARSTASTVVTTPGPSRTEYRGLSVYAMDDEEFLGVA